MELIIVDNKRTKVIYNNIDKTYKKILYPSFEKKIKYFFKIRKYPGYNCKYIYNIFIKSNIKTAEIINFDKYTITTKEIKGNKLMDELLSSNNQKGDLLLKKYINIVSKIINLDIYYGDFNFDNFIVSDEELYIVDLEDYRKDFLCRFRKKSIKKRLKRFLKCMESPLENKEFYNSESVYTEIISLLK